MGFQERADVFHCAADGHGGGVEELAQEVHGREFSQTVTRTRSAEMSLAFGDVAVGGAGPDVKAHSQLSAGVPVS
ncbi:hypothetical protein [Streptomyces sp. NBC_00280]|uniref:hypothetical protein n=1 Tax=Streptomyces sp. NBC_00280 TaxID=2975699 RepID=UPI00324B0A26